MRFLSVRELRSKSAEIWQELPDEGEMVITNNGRPIALLSSLDETHFEESLAALRQARAIEAVTSLQRQSVAQGTDRLSPEEIQAEIRSVRRRRAG